MNTTKQKFHEIRRDVMVFVRFLITSLGLGAAFDNALVCWGITDKTYLFPDFTKAPKK